MNRQEIAENAHAAFAGVTALRNRCNRVALVDSREKVQLDSGLDCFSELIRINRTEEAFGGDLLIVREIETVSHRRCTLRSSFVN